MLRWTADFPGGHPCIVCSNFMHYTDLCHHLLDIADNRTIKDRLEEVLELSLDNSTTQWLCELCYTNLRCIEEYYTLLTSFKKQYIQNALSRGELAQGRETGAGGIRTDGHDNSSKSNSANILSAVKFGEELLQNLGADEMETSIKKPLLAPSQSLQTKSQAKVAEAPKNVDSGEGAEEDTENSDSGDGEDDGGDLLGDDFMEDDDFGEVVNEDLIHDRERNQDEEEANSNSKESLETVLKSPIKTGLDEKSFNSGNASSSSGSSDESFTLEKPRKPRSLKKVIGEGGNEGSIPKAAESQDQEKANTKSKESLKTVLKSPVKTVLDEKSYNSGNASSSSESSDESFTLEKPRKPRSSKKRKNSFGNFSETNNGGRVADFTKKTFDFEKGRQKYTCEICLKVYYLKDKMLKHMDSHTKQAFNETSGKIECITCAKTFESNHEWQTHMKVEHQDNDKPFSCLQCNQTFKRYHTLAEHIKTHNIERSHICSCGKSFISARRLRNHKYTSMKHSQGVICPKCGKMLHSNSYLMRHMDIVHETEGPYEFVCDICEAGFHYKGSLRQHKKKHETGKHFLCTICGMSFTTNHTLIRHNLIHTDEKPYSCSYCQKKFRHESSLKCHILSHTGRYQHRCQICNKGFFRKIDLTRHGVTHSND